MPWAPPDDLLQARDFRAELLIFAQALLQGKRVHAGLDHDDPCQLSRIMVKFRRISKKALNNYFFSSCTQLGNQPATGNQSRKRHTILVTVRCGAVTGTRTGHSRLLSTKALRESADAGNRGVVF